MITLQTLRVDLTPSERTLIRQRLKREPNPTELSMIDVMWSEHCSYKSSRRLLKLLPTTAKQVMVGPGFDAGVVDIGDGNVVAFKLESHNHPSAIEPYNGAATGVGGILRDILSMGCRPIALLDSLRFGSLESGQSKWLFENVVKGIADYGNRVGVPTVGGEVEFDESFEANCLVNVACIGVGKKSEIVLPRFEVEGDLVALAGGSTGRDGIHGATFASRNITEESEEDRPAVQVADAFTEKLVIEAVLEARKTGYVHAVKDLGGGGLTCAASEMAHKGGMGVELELDCIHMRETGMTPSEILLSESQERMLLSVDPQGIQQVKKVFDKYEIPFSLIGRVNKTGRVEAKVKNSGIVSLPTDILAEAPILRRKDSKPSYLDALGAAGLPSEAPDLSSALAKVIASPNIASKRYVFEQYDHEVGIRTVVKPGDGDAAVLRLLENDQAIAVSADCNSKHCYVDPYNGSAGAVAQAVQNVVAVGASPLAIADGCNFGSPEKPEVYWQFSEALEGMSYMLSGLGLPCVGGNVSFYNEDEQTHRAVKPTVIVVALGLIEDLENVTTLSIKGEGETIIAVGATYPELGGSEYGSQVLGTMSGKPPKVDSRSVNSTVKTIESAIEEGLVTAAHDCSKGGLSVAVSLMSLKGGFGAEINLDHLPTYGITRNDELLFSESYGRFLITTSEEDADRVLKIAKSHKAPAQIIGKTQKNAITFKRRGRKLVHYQTEVLEKLWRESIPKMMGS